MNNRINFVGGVWIVLGALSVLGGPLIALMALGMFFGGQTFLMANSETGGWLIAGGMLLFACCIFAMGWISISAGLALRKRQPWARTAIVILSVINLINFPIGTAIGLYSLIVLFYTDVRATFAVP